jgi:Flp pilus assembly protein TadG
MREKGGSAMASSGGAQQPSVRRGQALVEFALVAPVMLLLLLVAVDFGRVFFSYIAVNNAAREGALYAAEHAKDTPFDAATYNADTIAAALREANVQTQGGEGAITVTNPTCADASSGAPVSCQAAATVTTGIGSHVTVTATQPFDMLTPIIGDILGSTITISASASAPVLNAPSVTVLEPAPTPTPFPTPSPAPTPTPSPSPSPSPTLPPGATPAPTPSPTAPPTPTPVPTCRVPDLIGQFYNTDPSALFAWQTTAGFTGQLVNSSEDKKIGSQSRFPNTVIPCTSTMEVSNAKNLAYKG